MASFNKVILAGHLTRDPEIRYTPKGTPVAKFGLGINRTWTAEDGQKREEATFVDVEAWGKAGEVIAQYLKKGRPVLVEGRLKLDSWEDKETGKKNTRLKVVLESFSFIDAKRDEGGGGYSAPAPAPAPATNAKPAVAGDGPPDEDDVPF